MEYRNIGIISNMSFRGDEVTRNPSDLELIRFLPAVEMTEGEWKEKKS